MSEREPESRKTGFPLRGKDGKGTFRTNEVRILRKAPDVSPGKFTDGNDREERLNFTT